MKEFYEYKEGDKIRFLTNPNSGKSMYNSMFTHWTKNELRRQNRISSIKEILDNE